MGNIGAHRNSKYIQPTATHTQANVDRHNHTAIYSRIHIPMRFTHGHNDGLTHAVIHSHTQTHSHATYTQPHTHSHIHTATRSHTHTVTDRHTHLHVFVDGEPLTSLVVQCLHDVLCQFPARKQSPQNTTQISIMFDSIKHKILRGSENAT